MPTTRKGPASKSSRLGTKDYKSPPPLRFKTVADARKYIKANRLRVKEHHSHARGARIQVVDRDGKPRTLSINRRKGKSETATDG